MIMEPPFLEYPILQLRLLIIGLMFILKLNINNYDCTDMIIPNRLLSKKHNMKGQYELKENISLRMSPFISVSVYDGVIEGLWQIILLRLPYFLKWILGFRKDRPSNGIDINAITTALDNDDSAIGIFLDFATPLGTVNHWLLTRYGLRMRQECRERFTRHRLQRKPLFSDPGMHHGTHVPWCMSGSLAHGGGENVPGIPGACATSNFTYLARGSWRYPW